MVVQPSFMMIRFGEHDLDVERYWLRFRGERLAIRPKVFDLLVLLVQHRQRVVLRDEIVLALWGTTAVGPGSLSGLVNELRQVLGEAVREPSLIRTVHARGYQFIGIVDPVIDALELRSPNRDRLNVFLAARGIAALPDFLADALVAHVRDDTASLESIVRWLHTSTDPQGGERDQLEDDASGVRKPLMRRVGAARSERRSRVEGRG